MTLSIFATFIIGFILGCLWTEFCVRMSGYRPKTTKEIVDEVLKDMRDNGTPSSTKRLDR